MSGQGWDETGTLQNPRWRKLFASLQRAPGAKGRDRSCKGTYNHTPSPRPLKKKKKKPHHLTPNSNVINTPALLPVMPY